MIIWETEPNFIVIDVLQYMYPSIKCSVENNKILKYADDESNTPTKTQIETTAASDAYINYKACRACQLAGGFYDSCVYGSLTKQKECMLNQVDELKVTKNNDYVQFVKDSETYKTKLEVTEDTASQVVFLLQRVYADEWDEESDTFKCTKVSDDSECLVSATKQQAKKFAKNCSLYQSTNVQNKKYLEDLIDAAETLEELHQIDIYSGWADSTLDID